MILGDFDNDERIELIVAAYQDGSDKIFYIFPIDSLGFNDAPPHVGSVFPALCAELGGNTTLNGHRLGND